ncbi:MAG: MFS transporter [Microthrixaceae bacterium]
MPAKPGLRDAAAAFRFRNFRLFWIGALLSNSGTWLQNLTVPYVVFQLTHSSTWVGVAAFSQLAPMAVLSPLGGTLADRLDRRRVLMWTQSAMAVLAVTMGVVWVTGRASVPAIIALVALGGVVTGINAPAWQAFVSELVPRDALLNAVTLNSAQFNAARAFGPGLGGLVLVTLGPGPAFFINAASYGAVLVALRMITLASRPAATTPRPRILADAGDTIAYVRSHRGMAACYLAVVALGLFGQPIFSLVVVFAEEVFSVGGLAYGVLSAALGIGAVLAAPIVAGPGSGMARSRLAGGAMTIYGGALVCFALAPVYPVALIALLVAGGAYLPIAATLNTTLQIQVDEAMRGKVLALYLTLFTLSIPIGSLVQGWTSDLVGPRTTVTVAGVAYLVATSVLRRPGLLGHLDD